MERLTRRMCGGWGLVKGCEINTPVGMRRIVERLAAYENTGLEPEEIQQETLAPIDPYEGLKRKYIVRKSDTGEIVNGCFVLRPDKDSAAVAALRAYSAATDNEALAADIIKWVGAAGATGRLVVLPCLKGDVLWSYYNYPAKGVYSFTVTDVSALNGAVLLNTDRCGVIPGEAVGVTVFPTREEAVEALNAGDRA